MNVFSWHNKWLTSYKARNLAISRMLNRQMTKYQYFSKSIINRLKTFAIIALVCSCFLQQALAQKNEMVELKNMIPTIQYDLKYATKNNFTGKRIYPSSTNKTFLVKDAAEALQKVAAELKSMDMGIWVWDAYRPYRATVKFWKLIHDERYVANPAKGSGHNRGIAIDMSIYRLSDGKLIEMPTGFDNFSDTAHHDFMQLPENKIKNRALLKTMMERHGFRSFETEWWHYSWPNNKNYEVLNMSFKKLAKQ
ncbi:MAG: peptidase M15 [Chitinophagia bacterium]|nr:peptidase M15 [Chitinophagia bacterium]